MNQRTQLQFNLGVAPHHAKLATNVDPSSQPSPVCIHTTGVETIGISHTPARTFKAASPERLAIAMKLAKRNARIKVQFDSCDEDEDEELGDDHDVELGDRYDGKVNKPMGYEDRVKPHPYLATDATRKGSKNTDQVKKPRQNTRKKPELIVKEIAQLKLALDQRLRTTKLARKPDWQDPDMKVVRDGLPLEEPQISEEREQQRKEEQHARNSRMIYDLSQQVQSSVPH